MAAYLEPLRPTTPFMFPSNPRWMVSRCGRSPIRTQLPNPDNQNPPYVPRTEPSGGVYVQVLKLEDRIEAVNLGMNKKLREIESHMFPGECLLAELTWNAPALRGAAGGVMAGSEQMVATPGVDEMV